MKKITVLLLCLFICGCQTLGTGSKLNLDDPSSEFGTSQVISSSSTGNSVNSTPSSSSEQYFYNMGCVFFVNKNGDQVGVLTNGKAVPVSSEYAANIDSGYTCESVKIQVNSIGDELIVNTVKLNTYFKWPIPANQKDAAEKFIRYNLESHLFTGSINSISAYEIESIQMISESNPLVFTVDYNFTPARYASGFKDYKRIPGQYGQVPKIAVTQTITLLEYEGQWLPYFSENDLLNPYLEKIPDSDPNQGTVLNNIDSRFETEKYSYTFERVPKDGKNLSQFIGVLKRGNKSDGNEVVLWQAEGYILAFLDQYRDEVYFTISNFKNDEPYDAGFLHISESTGKVVTEDAYNICAVTDDLIYCGKNIKIGGNTETVLQIYSMKENRFIGVWKDILVFQIDYYYWFRCVNDILIWEDYDSWHHFDYITGVDTITGIDTYWVNNQ